MGSKIPVWNKKGQQQDRGHLRGLTLARTCGLTRVGPEERSAALVKLGGKNSQSEKRNVEALKHYVSNLKLVVYTSACTFKRTNGLE